MQGVHLRQDYGGKICTQVSYTEVVKSNNQKLSVNMTSLKGMEEWMKLITMKSKMPLPR